MHRKEGGSHRHFTEELGLIPQSARRQDVDGLRGLAVLSVLVFHSFPTLLPGGYIGVDVFFGPERVPHRANLSHFAWELWFPSHAFLSASLPQNLIPGDLRRGLRLDDQSHRVSSQ